MIKKIIYTLCYFLALFKAEAQVWNDVGGAYGGVYAFHIYGNELYVGGQIKTPSFGKYVNIANWNGTVWDSLNYGVSGGIVYSLSDYDGEIYIGGSFEAAGHRDTLFPPYNPYTSHIAKYDGENWYAVKIGEVPDHDVFVMKYRNQLIIGGSFYKIGNTVMKEVATWDGQDWSGVGGGVSGDPWGVSAMVEYNGDLIIGGAFYRAGGDTAIGVARWDGSQWHDMGIGLHGNVTALVVDTINNILYAGGTFSSTGSVYNPQPTLCNIAQWDAINEKWIAVGNECGSIFYNGILSLCMYHGELYAGGYGITAFTSDTIIAKWNGWEWKPIGQGQIYGNGGPAMIVFQDELYVGGYIDGNTNSGDTIHGIARYYAPPDTTLAANKPLIKQTAWLYDNRPNPSVGTTQIPYYLPQGKTGELIIHDTQGREIKRFVLQTGKNYIEVNTKLWQSGVYINTLVWDGGKRQSKRMVVE